jgi:hypothetical protein
MERNLRFGPVARELQKNTMKKNSPLVTQRRIAFKTMLENKKQATL